MKRVLVIGEAMLELRADASGGPDCFRRAVAGDVYNTAVYLKRVMGESADVAFLTALGDDAASETMRAAFTGETISLDEVRTIKGGTPGLYMIHTDDKGERSFSYWRSTAAARQMLDDTDIAALAETIGLYDLVYFSGITLAILPPDAQAVLIAAADMAKAKGTTIAFDPNYRPRLWGSKDIALAAYANAYAIADILFPGMDDERDLYGSKSPDETLERLAGAGCSQIVLKAGDTVWLKDESDASFSVPVDPVTEPVDTTAAGDSFAAGWLAAWLSGDTPESATRKAHQLAAFVVTQPGAICSQQAFDGYLKKETTS